MEIADRYSELINPVHEENNGLISEDRSMDRFKPLIKDFIRFYYYDLDNNVGGTLHIALDDGNLEESDLWFCQEACEANGDSFGYFLAALLRTFTVEEREAMYQDKHWGLRQPFPLFED